MNTIPFLLPRAAKYLKANWQTANHSSLADIASPTTELDNVIGFPHKFEHGAQVWPKKCTMQRASD